MKGAINVMHDLKDICKASRTCSDCSLNDAGITLCLESPGAWDEDDIQFIVKYSKQIKKIAKFYSLNKEANNEA